MATYSNLFIDQGSDFNFSVDLATEGASVNLAGYSARGQIRKSYTSSTATDFIITIDDSDTLSASLTAAQTGALKPGRYVYDIEILSGDATPIVTRVVEGQIDVTPRVTTG
jgi:hypothetical protein